MGRVCGGMISLCVCVSVPFVFECVGEGYYMVLVCSFCDVVLQTGLCSTCTHSSAESECMDRCMVMGQQCVFMFARRRYSCVGLCLHAHQNTHFPNIWPISTESVITVFLLFHNSLHFHAHYSISHTINDPSSHHLSHIQFHSFNYLFYRCFIHTTNKKLLQ